jgi:hypothetical protein
LLTALVVLTSSRPTSGASRGSSPAAPPRGSPPRDWRAAGAESRETVSALAA